MKPSIEAVKKAQKPLEEVAEVKEESKTVKPTDFSKLTNKQLKEKLDEMGTEYPKGATKKELLSLLNN
jgi:16S rRNA C1402 (ribose-2'-O) methylase RsmI